uniref:adenylate/guanylate cyclase domain-containing protein n=1 Tax=Armatimonas sp. TaxID=1872638 RepID=UPI00286C53A4
LQASLVPLTMLTMLSLVQERLSRETFLVNFLLEQERAKSDTLLHNILPTVIVHRLKESPATIADRIPATTVLFADIVNFTPLAAQLSAEQIVALLNEVFSAFDTLAQKYGLEKIKTIGDAYMAVAGAPEPRANHAQDAAKMALEMRGVIAGFSRANGESLQLRIGLNSGPVVAGVIGINKFTYDLWGDTVNTASRMESQGTAGQIQVTEVTQALLGADFTFEEPQETLIKGKGKMLVYTLIGLSDSRTDVSKF